MNASVLVDILIVVIVLAMTVNGYWSGLLKSGSAIIGLVVGLVIAVPLSSYIGQRIESVGVRVGVVVGIIVLLANAGYLSGFAIGGRLARRVRRRASRGLDRAAGGAVSALIAVALVWTVALPLAASPLPGVSKAVRGSVVLPIIDDVMPAQARSLYDTLADAIAEQGLPDVLGPLQQTQVADVAAPNDAAAATPQVQAASASVLKVVGFASQCARQINGSGFAFAPGRVVTNAHVVAGTTSVKVQRGGKSYDATVVYVNESIDVAVLKVNDLAVAALPLNSAAPESGADVVVAGYPHGGPFALVPARVRAVGNISGPTFRGDKMVTRNVVALRGSVVGGNSGGPLLDPNGEVVGLVFAAAADEPDVGYALSVAQISGLLAAGAAATQPVLTGHCYG